jgi:hypothetical protein
MVDIKAEGTLTERWESDEFGVIVPDADKTKEKDNPFIAPVVAKSFDEIIKQRTT